MSHSLKPSSITASFYIAFASWVAALSYQSPSFYRHLVGSWLEIALHLIVIATLAATLIVVVAKSTRWKIWPLLHLTVLLGAIGAAELAWRFWISRGPSEFKLVGVIFDVGTPLVAALGAWAFGSELQKRPHQSVLTQTPR